MKFAIVSLIFVIVAGSGIAQDDKLKTTKKNKPDFSGLWKVDTRESQSMMGANVTGADGTATKKVGPGKEDFIFSVLLIEHHDPELKVIEKSEYNARANEEVIYFTDGRRETNTEPGGKTIHSKTKWDGKTLVTTVFRKPEAGKKADTITARITWELSKDGKTLTTIWKPVDPKGGPQSMARFEYLLFTSKTVYQRVQG